MTDDVANRIFEGWYGKYGEPYHKHVLYDGASHVISALPPGGPHPSSVRVILNEDIDLLLDAPLDTAQTRVAWPDGIWTSFVVGTGNDGVNDFIDIDATGDFAAALPLLESGVAILSVFDAFDATFGEGTTETHTAGVWTSVTYNDGPDTTTLTHDDGDPGSDLIASYMEGWFVQLNADLPVVRTVLSVSGDSITVSGNATSIVGAGDAYCIMHPPGVDVTTGATQTDPCVKESRYLWAHGLYYAPVVGFYMLHDGVLDIHGAQPGSNLSGQYYFWNRVLDSFTGRWTTPDPAALPWWNLHDYVGNNPINSRDPAGLGGWTPWAICMVACYLDMKQSEAKAAVTGEVDRGTRKKMEQEIRRDEKAKLRKMTRKQKREYIRKVIRSRAKKKARERAVEILLKKAGKKIAKKGGAAALGLAGPAGAGIGAIINAILLAGDCWEVGRCLWKCK